MIFFSVYKPIRVLLSKHLLGTVSQLLNGVGIIIYRLLKDHLAFQHQHGALFILEREGKEEYVIVLQMNSQCRLPLIKKCATLIKGNSNHVIMLMDAELLVFFF